MHISLFVYGSWGDLRPFVVLAKGLQAAGHDVQIVAARVYEEWIRARNLGYAPLSVDMNKLITELSSTDFDNPLQQIKVVREALPPVFTQMGLDLLDATRGSDVLVTIEIAVAAIMGVTQLNNLKMLVVNPAPLTPTAEFATALPTKPGWFPFEAWYNRTSYTLFRRLQWTLLGGPRKALNKKLGLPGNNFKQFQAALDAAPTLTIVSPSIVPRPSDWESHQDITGYLFDDDADWTPPKALTDFLAAGEAPVYIGFGSMPDSKPEASTRTIIEAVGRAGKRAVILTGWAGLGVNDVPDNIHMLKYASHHWLFPQMTAVVHHGGAGTTAAGLRAGVPTVIVPHQADQPYWGRKVKQLGVGTDTISRKKLSVETLSQAITTATTSETMREKARALSQKIAAEDGLSAAVKWFERQLA